ncbi:MAG: hypothetical protein AABY93_07245 [Bacteroidota bacterium]
MSHAWITIIFLFILVRSSAQSINKQQVLQRYDAYQAIWSKAYAHLVFNQNKYSPGDTVWFKAYFLNEDLTGVPGKQLIELNLIDSIGASKLHLLFSVYDGVGHNQFAIPDALQAGMYLVTAHSSWMKNFGPSSVFKKEIIITRDNEILPDTKPFFRVKSEGGRLIGNVSNKVSIWTHLAGSVVQIVYATGQEVGQTQIDSNGLGNIIFTPAPNASYFAQVLGESMKVELPPIEADGCSLLLQPSLEGEPARVVITSPVDSDLRKKELLIVVNTQGKILHSDVFQQESKDFVDVQIPIEKFPEGIAHLSILDQDGKLLAGRDFYIPPVRSVMANILTTNATYKNREKVKVELSLLDENGQPVQGEFSMKVLNASLFDDTENSFVDDLITLSNDRNKLHINRSDSSWVKQVDNFLILETEEVPWKKIVSNDLEKPRYTFTSGIQRMGQIYFNDPPEPVPDLTQIMFYLQKSKMRYQTFTLEKGKMGLAIPDIFETDEFFYMAHSKQKEISNIKVKWEDSLLQLPNPPAFRKTENPDRYASFNKKCRLIDKSFDIYSSSPEVIEDNVNKANEDFEDEINAADIKINLKDYVLMPTMAEVIKEVIPSVYHRKTSKKSIVRISLLSPMAMPTDDPLYIIDGIATKNTDFFLSLNPADLVSVKIVNTPKKLIPLGLMGRCGIIIVQTKRGNVREPLDDVSKLVQGICRPLAFNAQNQKHSQPNKPDFRSTIFWNPSITTDAGGKATVEFYCSDDVGELQIRIEGLATGGRPFSATHKLEVVN